MIFLLCPQYKIRRFYVKDKKEKSCLVQVTTDHVVVPCMNGTLSKISIWEPYLYCLGCS